MSVFDYACLSLAQITSHLHWKLFRQGRMKFVRPLYRALCKSEKGKELAISTFLMKKDFYHPICAKMVASDLLPSKKKKRSVTREIAHHLLVGATVGFAVAIGMSILRGRKR